MLGAVVLAVALSQARAPSGGSVDGKAIAPASVSASGDVSATDLAASDDLTVGDDSTFTGDVDARTKLVNGGTTATCSSNTGAVCVDDAGGLAVANGSGTTTATISAAGAAAFAAVAVDSLKPPLVHGSGTAQQAMEFGSATLSALGTVTVTFGTAFTAAPKCVGTDNDSNPAMLSHSPATTTTVAFQGDVSATFDWICIGER